MKKHQKHAKLARPTFGQFSRNEWAIIGTPCGAIKTLAFEICEALSDQYRIAYVDADHKSGDDEAASGRDRSSAMAFGAKSEYTDKISFHRLDFEQPIDQFQFRTLFNAEDVVLVNGNHFKAKQQIVVIDPRKEASLKKKLDRLTDVKLILLSKGVEAPFDFILDHLKDQDQPTVLSITARDSIADFLRSELKTQIAPISGLVLAGGKSQRMGKDKGMINYHGIPQRQFLFDLMETTCKERFYSCRADQKPDFEGLALIFDRFVGLGPYGAILSAFLQQPDAAWLVVAVDLPLIDESIIADLCKRRNPSKLATAYLNPETGFPDPLLTIWEPRAYPVLLQFLAQGYSCPRKVLINADIELLETHRPEVLTNVNSPEEMELVLKKIS